MATTGTVLTFEQFERLPERPGKDELLRGELIELPPADRFHYRIAMRVFKIVEAALMSAHAFGHALNLGEVCLEMGYRLAHDSWVVPDVSVMHAGQVEEKYVMSAPTIAVEVVSPGNTPKAIKIKTELYFEFGALEVWHVYPKTGKVAVYTSVTSVTEHHDTLTTPLIPGFTMSIAEILA
jgi:Uma2 family endonuclease